MIGLIAAAAASLAVGEGLTNAQLLQPALARLAAARSAGNGGSGGRGKPFHILQIGDSHSAGDAISGAWRDTVQARYGSGGRGVLPPGRPYDGYLTRGVTAAMSPGWAIASDFGRGWGGGGTGGGTMLGLAAFTLTSLTDGATMALDADPLERFDRVVICGVAKPGAGATVVRLGDQVERLAWGSPTQRPECRTLRASALQSHVDLTTEGGPVTLTSWATFADHGGVVVSNLGVVGSQLVHFGRTDDAVLAEELGAYQPDLIVIAFGTNEGFSPRLSPFEYEAILRSQIGRVRRLAGNVPILLLGAPDALTRRPELKANAPGGNAEDCGSPPPAVAAQADTPTALGTIVARLRDMVGLEQPDAPAPAAPPAKPVYPAGAVVQQLPAPSATAPVRAGLFPPAALSVVRGIQKRVALSLHVAYWDWEGRMGGRCTAARWARATPPLMRGDYVHYTKAGGKEIADRLQADLDRAAQR